MVRVHEKLFADTLRTHEKTKGGTSPRDICKANLSEIGGGAVHLAFWPTHPGCWRSGRADREKLFHRRSTQFDKKTCAPELPSCPFLCVGVARRRESASLHRYSPSSGGSGET